MNANHVVEWNSATFDQQLGQSSLPVLVDFYAPWCGPCRMLTPLLERLAEHYAGRILFAKVNIDESPELTERYEITGVPTMLLFRDGKLTDEVVGLPSPKALAFRMESMLAPSNAGNPLCQAGGGPC